MSDGLFNMRFEPGKAKPMKPRYRCTCCHHRTTKNQAKINGGRCFACKAPLRAALAGQIPSSTSGAISSPPSRPPSPPSGKRPGSK